MSRKLKALPWNNMGDVNLTEGQDLIGQEISTRASQIAHFAELSTGAGETTFKVNNQGMFMGASNYGDAPFKVDYSGNMTAANAEFPGGTVTGGQTAYNTGTGFWMGLDGTVYKFSIGDGSTKYLTWDGTSLTIRGTLNADDITAGTLTGRVIQTSSSTSAERVIIDPSASNQRSIQIKNSSNAVRGWIGKGEESSTDLAINTTASLDLSFASGLGYDRSFYIQKGGIFCDDSQDDKAVIGSTGTTFAEIIGYYIKAKTKFVCDNNEGVTGSFEDKDGNTITVKGGIITNLGT